MCMSANTIIIEFELRIWCDGGQCAAVPVRSAATKKMRSQYTYLCVCGSMNVHPFHLFTGSLDWDDGRRRCQTHPRTYTAVGRAPFVGHTSPSR